jgi:pimeloyl-ACP methyl ester carboxylesterase
VNPSEVFHGALDFVKANGITLAYDSFGNAADEPVILIQGLSSQMILWEDVFCEGIASHGYRVIRFDNRDVGLSTRFGRAGTPDIRGLIRGEKVVIPYTLTDMALDTLGLLDGLGIEKAHVVGASMGGMIGQELAIRFPGRVISLTSIMSTTGGPGLPPPSPGAVQMLLWPIPEDRQRYVEYFRKVWRFLSGPVHPMDGDSLDTLGAAAFERGVDPSSSARQFAAILAAPSRRSSLGGVSVPTLVIHGDMDPLVDLECGRDTARAVPGARLVVVEGMGHALPRSLWARIIDEIVRHVSGA